MNENFSASVIIIMALGITAAAAPLPLQLTGVSANIITTLTPVLLVPIASTNRLDKNLFTILTNKK